MRKILVYILLALIATAVFVYVNNTTTFVQRPPGTPKLLAHRGLAQDFDRKDLKSDTCTAARMLPTGHNYLENTLSSMQAAFDLGADVVELDVHPTTDRQLAVFHDWTVDCRTEGRGVTRDHSMVELKALDIGHGYTADGGQTFPFRGKGQGMMPSLDEVLERFPDRDFLINVKSADAQEGKLLAARLAQLPSARRGHLMVYANEQPIAVLREQLPDLRVMSRTSAKACLLRYMAYGWTGSVPDACRHTLLPVPLNVASWLWGWPDRFLNRMDSVGTRVFVQGDYHGGWSTGIDTAEDLARLPKGYSGGVFTDRLEVIAPLVR